MFKWLIHTNAFVNVCLSCHASFVYTSILSNPTDMAIYYLNFRCSIWILCWFLLLICYIFTFHSICLPGILSLLLFTRTVWKINVRYYPNTVDILFAIKCLHYWRLECIIEIPMVGIWEKCRKWISKNCITFYYTILTVHRFSLCVSLARIFRLLQLRFC